ncbi:MAG TPA: SpoIIIAH-like family protein [Limnochordia bacterium]|nr:SpoIIIAH-like family protein [Limnochordia bacterium]
MSATFLVVERKTWQLSGLVLALLAVAAVWWLSTAGREAPARGNTLVRQAAVTAPSAAATGGTVQIERGAANSQTANFYDDYRLARDQAESRSIEALQQAIKADASAEAKDADQARLFALLTRQEREIAAEQMLRSKGIADAVVIMDDSGANVVVAAELKATQAAMVGQLVHDVTKVALADISISDRASLP